MMQNFTFTTHLSDESGVSRLKMTFGGHLTLQNATQIKSSLQSQQANHENFQLIARDVSGLDVSFLQIIESYRRTLEEEGKKVSIVLDIPYDIKVLLANAGIEYPVK